MRIILTFLLLFVVLIKGRAQQIDSIKKSFIKYPFTKMIVHPKNQKARSIKLVKDVGLTTLVGKNSSVAFYTTLLDIPVAGFVPMEGMDFFSEIKTTYPEDDSDMKFNLSKSTKRFVTGVNLFSKHIEFDDDSSLEDEYDTDPEIVDFDDIEHEEDESPADYRRQGIRFSTTYHLLQNEQNGCDINLQVVVFQNSSGSNDEDGFDEDDLPSKTLIGGVGYRYKKLRIDLDSKFVSSIVSTSDQANRQNIKVINTSMSYIVNDKSNISIACNNILNENRLSKNGFGILRNPKLFLNQSRYFLMTYTINF